MAIIIPSKNTYNNKNQKIRDNVIKRIEVGAVEVSPNNEYEAIVYNETLDFSNAEAEQKSMSQYQDAIATNQGGSTIRNVRGACGLQHKLTFVTTPEIFIPKVNNNKLISKIFDGKDDDGNPRIKLEATIKQTNYNGFSTYQPSSNSFDFSSANLTKEENDKENIFYGYKDFEYTNDVSLNVSSLSMSSAKSLIANHSIVEENNKVKITSYLYADSNNNWSPSIITVDNYVSANLQEPYISVTKETINGVEYYKLSSAKVLIGLDVTFMSCLIENQNSFSSVSAYYRAVATRILQECQELTLSVYGNTIGINLTDKTIYINGETAKKVHSIDGNELMQTSNYIEGGEQTLVELVEGSDFSVEYGMQNGVDHAYIYLLDWENLLGEKVLVRIYEQSGDIYYDEEYIQISSPTITVDNGGYHIDRVKVFLVSVNNNAITNYYERTQDQYKNGKETATIRCSISDYYEYDSTANNLQGKKVISPFLSKLPQEYQEVEYIESTGTQWIDVGVTISTATDEVSLVFQNTESVVYKWFFGEHDNNARFGLGSGDGVNKRNVAYGNNTYKVADEQFYNSQHKFFASTNGVFLDDVKIANFAPFASSSTLYLFNLNLGSGNYTASSKVWAYKHTRNGVLIRDFVPCYRKNDGTVGMYDLVSKMFFTNQGSGQFIKGNDINVQIGEKLNMSFALYDKVIPLVRGADGTDHPMSVYNDGAPKVFQVFGKKVYYDGAVWQELSLQEE